MKPSKWSCFVILFLLNFSIAYATDSVSTAIKELPSINKMGIVDYESACTSCEKNSNGKKQTLLYSKDNNQKIELSVISEKEAQQLFTEIASRKDIPFGYPLDGCYARAHKVVRILEEKGIISGKAFLEGDLYVNTRFGEIGWGYHVAPVLMVEKGNQIIPMIFDPALFSKPVTFEDWKAKMTMKSSSRLHREYYTNRFAYEPGDRTRKLDKYEDEPLNDMEEVNKSYLNELLTNPNLK